MSWSRALRSVEYGEAVARPCYPFGKCVVAAGDEVRFNDLSGSGPTYDDKDATDWFVVSANELWLRWETMPVSSMTYEQRSNEQGQRWRCTKCRREVVRA
jgi:hypothetical protein